MDSTSSKKKAPAPPKSDVFPGYVNMKDTFKLISDKKEKSQKVESDSSISSSQQSSIPEMTKLEERQLKRSFQAIQRPVTPTSPVNMETGGHFNIAFSGRGTDAEETITFSDRGADAEETITTPRVKQKDHLDDSDEDEKFDRARSSGMFKTPLTESKESVLTMDSDEDEKFDRARSSGMFKTPLTESKESVLTMGSTDSNFVPVTPRSQTSASLDMEKRFEQLTNPRNTSQWRMLFNLEESKMLEQDSSPETSVHIISPQTRERTPDATASKGSLVIGGNFGTDRPAVNAGKLGATMRDVIKDVHQMTERKTPYTEQETSFSLNSYQRDSDTGPQSQQRSPLGQTTRGALRQQTFDQETNTRPKTSYTQSSELETDYDRGNNEKEPGPCLPKCILFGIGVSILLAGIIAVIVVFRDNAEQERKFGEVIPDPINYQACANVEVNLTNTFTINCSFDLTHPDHMGVNYSDYVDIVIPNGDKNRTKPKFSGGNWTSIALYSFCDTIGTYNIIFKTNGSRDVTVSMNVTLPAPTIETTIEQMFYNDSAKSSDFNMTCTVSGDCNNYIVNMVGVGGSTEDLLDENRICTITYDNTLGNRMTCTARINGTVADQYNRMRCKVNTAGTSPKYKDFSHPQCGKTCSDGRVNCTDKSSDRSAIDSCGFGPNFTTECFHPGRKIFSQCISEQNACTCEMNWCQQGDRIVKDEHPGLLLCGIGYQPLTFTERPTTQGPPSGSVGD